MFALWKEKKLFTWVIFAALTLVLGIGAAAQPVFAAPTSVDTATWEVTGRIAFGSTMRYHYRKLTQVNDENVDTETCVYCCEPINGDPEGAAMSVGNVYTARNGVNGQTIMTFDGTNEHTMSGAKEMRKLLYYLPAGGYGWTKYTSKWVEVSEEANNMDVPLYGLSAAILAKEWGRVAALPEGDAMLPYRTVNAATQRLIDMFLEKVPNLPDPPESFTAIYIKTPNAQDLWGALYAVENGKAKVVKTSANPEITQDNSGYNLAGAEYTLYTDSACTTVAKDKDGNEAVLTTDVSGSTNEIEISANSYWVKETKPSKGYALDKTVYTVNITDGKTATINSSETPKSGPFTLQKYDIETGAPVPLGGASFKDAEFEVKYTDGGNINKTWVIKTDENGYAKLDDAHKVSGDDFYKNSKGENVMPLGTVTVKETKAPEGYLLNNETFTVEIVNNTAPTEETVDTKFSAVPKSDRYPDKFSLPFPEQVIRGDVLWNKVHESDQDSHPAVPFVIKSKTTGEAHVVVTDENGEYRSLNSKNRHSNNTNGADSVINADGTPILNDLGLVEISDEWVDNGLWFYKDRESNETQIVNDNLGALPYDTYTITEIPCEANKEFGLLEFSAVIKRDAYEVNIGTKNEPTKSSLKTVAQDRKTQSHITKAEEEAVVYDTVQYENLTAGKEYTVTGFPVDKETGEAIEGITAKTTFKPTSSNGSVKLAFTFNSKELEGKTIVFFEKLYLGTDITGEPTATHEDPEDTDQTIYIPKVRTTATDKDSGSHTANAGTDVTVVDKVLYENLIPGEEYTVKGELIYKATGKSTKVTAEKTFTPNEPNGSVDLEFRFNASKIGGSSLVAFETLYDMNGKVVGEHKDIEDPDQTVTYPNIKTTLLDKKTGAHVGNADSDTVVVDTVKYENLVVGQKYTLEGELMDKDTHKSTGVTATAEFTPESANGSVELEFKADTSKLAGHTVVAFETLKMATANEDGTTGESKTVAEHKDIDDEAQSVHIPNVKTTAADKETQEKTITSGVVVDVVKYENLVPGLKYTVEGELMDKESGNSTGIKASKEFTPTEASGEVTLEFKIDSEWKNKTLVAFETLKLNGKIVGQHKDINDPDQTVKIAPPTSETPNNPSNPGSPQTGQAIPWILIGLLALIGVAGGYAYRNRKTLFNK